RADVARATREGMPDASLTVAARDLALTTRPKEIENPDGTVRFEGEPVHSEGMDIKLQGTLAGATGDLGLDASIVDRVGTLLDVRMSARAPFDRLLAG